MDITKTLNNIASKYQRILGNNLVGLYVHGSLAFGCFNPKKSDIDFIVVVYNPIAVIEKEALISTLLNLSTDAPEKGYEMSVVLLDVCKNFVYPTPFELHYSNAHLQKCKDNLRTYCESMHGVDKDLAAHFTIIKEVGYSVIGELIDKVFGDVPDNYYLDSIKSDAENAPRDVTKNPVSTILNLCRVLAYEKEGLVLSKEQGGIWGIDYLPNRYIKLIDNATESYQSKVAEEYFNRELLLEFCRYMMEQIFSK